MYHSSGGLRGPPGKVAGFLMYLFQDRKLQPNTIDGYRSAIADRLGNSPINISRMKISLVSWIVSTETDPKAGRESPSWNLSLVFAPADKVHFEPIKEASLKHLTFKTFSAWPWGRASVEVRYMLGKTKILDTNPTGQRCPCTHHLAFFPRIRWPKRVQTVWPQGL